MPIYKNPKIYVTTPEPTPWDRLQQAKRIATGIFIVIFTLGIVYLLFFSPVFVVSELLVEGPTTPEMETRFTELVGKNIFRLASDRLEQDLKVQYPYLKSITIYRGLPNALKIVVAARQEALIWESRGTRYLVDNEGFAFGEVPARLSHEALAGLTEQPATNPYPDLPLVTDQENGPVKIGSILVAPEFVQFTLTLHRDFKSTTGIGLVALRVGETTFQIEAVTDQKFIVFFDTTRSAERQLSSLGQLLPVYRDQIKEYVDLRVAGRAYIK